MYEYFGVGSQLLEDVDDMFPRFLLWLPKYHLSLPPKHSLLAWWMVIDGLTTDKVSFVFVCLYIYIFLVFFFCFLKG